MVVIFTFLIVAEIRAVSRRKLQPDRWLQMSHVMGDNAIRPAFHRQMNQHFIIGILQHRPPARASPYFSLREHQAIRPPFNFLMSVWREGLFTMQYLLVFCRVFVRRRVHRPWLNRQKLVQRATAGEQSRQ